jgi:acetate kinase
MSRPSFDVVVAGGGILGLATAHALVQRLPGASVAVLEKEPELATHQTGRNSGVIHSGIYYTPGSLKARLAVEGAERMVAFCAEHDIAHDRCGKLVVATDEAREIARQVAGLVQSQDAVVDAAKVPIAISARHIHLTQPMVERLFGAGHSLTHYKDISQPGQFAAVEKLNLIGPKNRIDGVRVLGPTRPGNQVEISRTDEFHLGLDAPIRNSGDISHSPGIILEGPAGTVALDHGLICARRHIHMHPDDAARFGVSDKDVVEVAIDSDGRDLIFGDVLVRVSEKYVLEMHIDTDEANAAELRRGDGGLLVATGAQATIRRRNLA